MTKKVDLKVIRQLARWGWSTDEIRQALGIRASTVALVLKQSEKRQAA
jgi:hypothetical protein